MRLLLDTHTLLWWALKIPKLSRRAQALLDDDANGLFVSAATAWEIATKYRLGRLPEAKHLMPNMSSQFALAGLVELPVSIEHGRHAGLLSGVHQDPFDRVLSAQSVLEEIPVLGRDKALLEFGVELIW
jgi:PIN domain nuclease of toxin-antitoxin system